MKCLTDQFQFCFDFCIGSTKQQFLYLPWQDIWDLYRHLAIVAIYAFSCFCIPVSNAVVE